MENFTLTITGISGLIAFLICMLGAGLLFIQLLLGEFWPKKIIVKEINAGSMICSGCGKPMREHFYTMCSKECQEIVSDQQTQQE